MPNKPFKPTTRRDPDETPQTVASADLAVPTATASRAWPKKGYSGDAPWELAHQHLKTNAQNRERVGMKVNEQDELVHGGANAITPEPYLGPGAVTHAMPILTQGVADSTYPGAVVSELARRLKELGYKTNSIARGLYGAGVFDASVWADVVQFQNDHGIHEHEASFAGGNVPASELVNRHVGPYTWQALIELSDRAERERVASWA